ncbi:MAG: DUF488 domain-containing protein [Nanoarchaeota archaeon]
MLYTKSILKEVSQEDGLRISVMSRHTLPNGITPDLRITSDSFHEHLQALAPPPELVGDYYKRDLTWGVYETRYNEYLRKPEVSREVEKLAKRATEQDITLLCIEDTPERCHRRLLAEACQRYQPELEVVHR